MAKEGAEKRAKTVSPEMEIRSRWNKKVFQDLFFGFHLDLGRGAKNGTPDKALGVVLKDLWKRLLL